MKNLTNTSLIRLPRLTQSVES